MLRLDVGIVVGVSVRNVVLSFATHDFRFDGTIAVEITSTEIMGEELIIVQLDNLQESRDDRKNEAEKFDTRQRLYSHCRQGG